MSTTAMSATPALLDETFYMEPRGGKEYVVLIIMVS